MNDRTDAIVVSDTCDDLQIDGQPETYCCRSCIDEDEGGWHDHRYSFLHEGRWVDAGFCCHIHYDQLRKRIIACLADTKPKEAPRDPE